MTHNAMINKVFLRTFAQRLAAFAVAASLAGCAQGTLSLDALPSAEPNLETSSITSTPAANGQTATADRSPKRAPKSSVAAAIGEARKLRLTGDKPRALQSLDAAADKDPNDKDLMKERGLVALETGKVKQAETLLRKAFDANEPDWRLHSGLGAALAAQGKQAEAQLQFAKALEIVPDHPSVLNNLALSYALDGKHAEAEKLLKRVTAVKGAEPKAQQNLALLLGLKGNVGEAKKISESVLPPETARVNVGYLESLRAGGERATVSRADAQAEPAVASAAAAAKD